MSRMNAKAIRFALSGALAVGLLAGCAGSASSHLARAGDHAVRTSGKLNRAVEAAEARVAKSPNDAAARLALGQAYIEAGRFESAATTFSDAIKLGDTGSGTQLRLALAQIGAGDTRSAVALLNDSADTIAPSDRGLALALAGETGRGVAVLLDALHEGEASPKLRQNLAFALALDGRWREARMAMAEDVPADQISDRIGQWADMARPEDTQKRVASLLGVPAGVADEGQPVALALGGVAPAAKMAVAETPAPAAKAPVTTELPAVTDAPAAAPAWPAPAAEPAPAPAPLMAAAESAPAPAPTAFNAAFAAPAHKDFAEAPVVQPAPRADFAPSPVVKAARAHTAHASMLAPKPAARPEAAPRVAAVTRGSTHVVQLGSFSIKANADRAVALYAKRNPELKGLQLTITPAVVNGRNFWRVAAVGLDRGGAMSLCSGLRNHGNACFAYAAGSLPGEARPAMALAGGSPRARRR